PVAEAEPPPAESDEVTVTSWPGVAPAAAVPPESAGLVEATPADEAEAVLPYDPLNPPQSAPEPEDEPDRPGSVEPDAVPPSGEAKPGLPAAGANTTEPDLPPDPDPGPEPPPPPGPDIEPWVVPWKT